MNLQSNPATNNEQTDRLRDKELPPLLSHPYARKELLMCFSPSWPTTAPLDLSLPGFLVNNILSVLFPPINTKTRGQPRVFSISCLVLVW